MQSKIMFGSFHFLDLNYHGAMGDLNQCCHIWLQVVQLRRDTLISQASMPTQMLVIRLIDCLLLHHVLAGQPRRLFQGDQLFETAQLFSNLPLRSTS